MFANCFETKSTSDKIRSINNDGRKWVDLQDYFYRTFDDYNFLLFYLIDGYDRIKSDRHFK